MSITTITSKNPVREEFSGCSTGNFNGSGRTRYYETKGHAVNAFDGALQGRDMWLDRDDLSDFYGDEGRKVIDVHGKDAGWIGRAVISWYRMPSGHYEFVGYLA